MATPPPLDNCIYLNSAGTSWPKPDSVLADVAAMSKSHPNVWHEQFSSAHHQVAKFFGIHDPTRLLLTPGCTTSLSLGIADHAWQDGDTVVVSAWEHHAVHRPCLKLRELGVDVKVIRPTTESLFDLELFEQVLQQSAVRLVAVSAASNVTGDLLPINEIIRIAHQYEALVLIDAAQTAGWLPLNIPELGADLVAFGGHKGLQAPWGIGGLYVAPDVSMNSPTAVCTLTPDKTSPSCAVMPGYCDAGSVDRIALAGLNAAVQWLEASPQSNRLSRCRSMANGLREAISAMPDTTVYGAHDVDRLPTVAFNFDGSKSTHIATQLAARNLFVGSGLQCAPLAHETLGTTQSGVVRLSVGPFNTEAQIQYALETVELLRKSS